MNKKFLLLTVLLFVNLSNLQLAGGFQDANPDYWLRILSTQRKRFHYFMGFSGAMVFRQYEAETGDAYIEPIWYFDHPTILAELDLDAETQSKIQTAFSNWHEEIVAEIRDSFTERQTDKDRTNSKKDEPNGVNLEVFKKCKGRLDSALSQQQSTRLKQIQLRFLINHNGNLLQIYRHAIGE